MLNEEKSSNAHFQQCDWYNDNLGKRRASA